MIGPSVPALMNVGVCRAVLAGVLGRCRIFLIGMGLCLRVRCRAQYRGIAVAASIYVRGAGAEQLCKGPEHRRAQQLRLAVATRARRGGFEWSHRSSLRR